MSNYQIPFCQADHQPSSKKVYYFSRPLDQFGGETLAKTDDRARHVGIIVEDPIHGLLMFDFNKDTHGLRVQDISSFPVFEKNEFSTSQWAYECGETNMSLWGIYCACSNQASKHPYTFYSRNCRSFTDHVLRILLLKFGSLFDEGNIHTNRARFKESPCLEAEHRIRRGDINTPNGIVLTPNKTINHPQDANPVIPEPVVSIPEVAPSVLQTATSSPNEITADLTPVHAPLPVERHEVGDRSDRARKKISFGMNLVSHLLSGFEDEMHPFAYATAQYGFNGLSFRDSTGFLHPFLSEQHFHQVKQVAHTAETAYKGYSVLSSFLQLYSDPSWYGSWSVGSALVPFAVEPLHQYYGDRYASGDAPETYLETAAEDIVKLVRHPHVNFVWRNAEVIGWLTLPALASTVGWIPEPTTAIGLATLIALIKVSSDQDKNMMHNAHHALLASFANPSQFSAAKSKLVEVSSKLYGKNALDLKQHGQLIAALSEFDDKRNDQLIEAFSMHTVESRFFNSTYHIEGNGAVLTVPKEAELIEFSVLKGGIHVGVPKKKTARQNLSEYFQIIDCAEEHSLATLRKVSVQLELISKSAEEDMRLMAEPIDYSATLVDPADRDSLSILRRFSENKIALAAEEKLRKYCHQLSGIISEREQARHKRNFSSCVAAYIAEAAAYNASANSANRLSFWTNIPSRHRQLSTHQAAKDLFAKPFLSYFTEDTRWNSFM